MKEFRQSNYRVKEIEEGFPGWIIAVAIATALCIIFIAIAIGASTNSSPNNQTASSSSEPSSESAILESNQSEDSLKSYKVERVVDGDTFKIIYNGEEKSVRLIGIDTPETVHPDKDPECYGQEASNYLKNKIEGKTVTLEFDETQGLYDAYDRLLAYAFLGEENVNYEIVANGYGKEYTYNLPYKYQSEFKAAENKAKNSKVGLWGTACKVAEAPKQEPAPVTTQECNIKGNISNKGEKIYHMPGQRYYDSTIITPSKGERWFCSEAEAQAAGWRKSKV